MTRLSLRHRSIPCATAGLASLLGGSASLSGPAATSGALAKASDARLRYTNDNSGVTGRELTYRSLDDVYNPARTSGVQHLQWRHAWVAPLVIVGLTVAAW